MLDLRSTRMYRCLFPPLLPESGTSPRLYFHSSLLESRTYARLSFSHRYMQGPSTRLLRFSESRCILTRSYSRLFCYHNILGSPEPRSYPRLCFYYLHKGLPLRLLCSRECYQHVYSSREAINVTVTTVSIQVETLSTSMLPTCLLESRSYLRPCYQRFYSSREVMNVSST